LPGKRALTAVAWALFALVVIVGLLWVFQRRLIYLPTQAVPDPPASVDEIIFETEDGLSLGAWLVEADDPRATVVVFNGNAGNRSHRVRLGEALARRGFSVLLTDYRGYGGNPGSPSEDGLARDARAALAWVGQRSSGPIVFYGESLGAGVAIGLAVEIPPEALILRSPFMSLPDIASVHYRWLPTSLLLHDHYSNLERIATIEAPVLVVAGSADRIVPPDQSRAIHDAANQPKELVIVEGAGHNDPALLDGEQMLDAIVAFLDRSIDR
jgi:uncharacterized protein